MSDCDGAGSVANDDLRLFESGEFADATIECGKQTWNVHRCILSSRSRWFRAAFHGTMVEGATSNITLREKDPKLVEVLLRFIYSRGIDIKNLSTGMDIPALCVRIFRLGDFFLDPNLKEEATKALNAHVGHRTFPEIETDNGESPRWVTEILDALAEAYEDASTEPLLEPLIGFVCLNWMTMFKFGDAVAFLDKVPELATEVIKRCAAGHAARQHRSPNSQLGLPVVEAMDNVTSHYGPATASIRTIPCVLYPVLGFSSIFAPVNPNTDSPIDTLGWMTPPANQVNTITGRENSEVIRVDTSESPGQQGWLYIRFGDPDAARAFVKRYCQANARIELVTANSATALTEAMRVRAVITGMDTGTT